MMSRIAILTAAALAAGGAAARAGVAGARRARFRKSPSPPHGGTAGAGNDFGHIYDVAKMKAGEQLNANDLPDSPVYQRMLNGSMPPGKKEPRPTKEDIEKVKAWIDAKVPPLPAAAPGAVES